MARVTRQMINLQIAYLNTYYGLDLGTESAYGKVAIRCDQRSTNVTGFLPTREAYEHLLTVEKVLRHQKQLSKETAQ